MPAQGIGLAGEQYEKEDAQQQQKAGPSSSAPNPLNQSSNQQNQPAGQQSGMPNPYNQSK